MFPFLDFGKHSADYGLCADLSYGLVDFFAPLQRRVRRCEEALLVEAIQSACSVDCLTLRARRVTGKRAQRHRGRLDRLSFGGCEGNVVERSYLIAAQASRATTRPSQGVARTRSASRRSAVTSVAFSRSASVR